MYTYKCIQMNNASIPFIAADGVLANKKKDMLIRKATRLQSHSPLYSSMS